MPPGGVHLFQGAFMYGHATPSQNPHICSLYAPCMLQGCSNYAPRMLHRCSATHSRSLVKQQMQFSAHVYPPISHPSYKYSTILPSHTAHNSVVRPPITPFPVSFNNNQKSRPFQPMFIPQILPHSPNHPPFTPSPIPHFSTVRVTNTPSSHFFNNNQTHAPRTLIYGLYTTSI